MNWNDTGDKTMLVNIHAPSRLERRYLKNIVRAHCRVILTEGCDNISKYECLEKILRKGSNDHKYENRHEV